MIIFLTFHLWSNFQKNEMNLFNIDRTRYFVEVVVEVAVEFAVEVDVEVVVEFAAVDVVVGFGVVVVWS